MQRYGNGCSDGALCWRKLNTRRDPSIFWGTEDPQLAAGKPSSLQDTSSDVNNLLVSKRLLARENSQPTACGSLCLLLFYMQTSVRES